MLKMYSEQSNALFFSKTDKTEERTSTSRRSLQHLTSPCSKMFRNTGENEPFCLSLLMTFIYNITYEHECTF